MVLTTTTIDTTKRDRGSVSKIRFTATTAGYESDGDGGHDDRDDDDDDHDDDDDDHDDDRDDARNS